MRRRILAAAALAWAAAAAPVQAQDKPALKILVGFPPGGSADVIARLVGDAIRDDYSAIVVENRPGAGGRIALTQAKNAKPDGQTVIVLPSGPMVLFPHVYKKLEYDPVKDFTPVSLLARFQFGVVSGPASGVKDVAGMLAKAKDRSRQRHLRLARPGHAAAFHGRADGAGHRRALHARAVPGRRACQQCAGGRPHRLQVRRGVRNRRAAPHGQGAHHRRHRSQARPAGARGADHEGTGHQHGGHRLVRHVCPGRHARPRRWRAWNAR